MPSEQTTRSNTATVQNKTIARFSPSALFAWGLALTTALFTVVGIAESMTRLMGQARPLELLAEAFFQVFTLAFAIVAALAISRQPGNRVGWLMLVIVIGGAVSFSNDYLLRDLTTAPANPSLFLVLSLWLSNISWTLFIFPILLLPLLFPTGQPPSRRWNWVIVYAIALLALFYFVVLFAAEISRHDDSGEIAWTMTNPIGLLPLEFIVPIFDLPWSFGLAGLTLVSASALIVRYRRGSSVERAQIKWVVYACSFFALVYVGLLPVSDQSDSFFLDVGRLLFALSLVGIPVCIGIAILRYRLWDIDFVINRSLVYGALTALLVVLFAASLLIINSLFQNFAGGPLVAVAISAAGFGAFIQPARRNLQRFVDRRFYNIQIDYNKTPSLPASATSMLKQTQFGDYRNLELIGRGGMAEIYKSIHPALGIPVVIKILPAPLASDPDFRRRFTREAQVVAQLEHPNIVRLFDFGEQGGTHFMVMEYMAGGDLSAALRNHGRLALAQALPLVRSIANALDYAHPRGLVHRDIKPSNVLPDSAGADGAQPVRAALADFGIAKLLGHSVLTRTGGMLGTLDYIAPEQIHGAANVDSRADIYSFGVLTYQLVTGELPFKHNNPGALLIAHLSQPAPDPCALAPEVSSSTGMAIQRAMAKSPDERFSSAGDFVNALV